MEQLTANLTGKVRRETLDGREYLVAPVAMIVAGRVLNGSQGSLYYPENEVAANPGMWNGVPITNGHPHEHGQNTSARQPSVMNTFAIGTVYNDRYDNGKRLAEGWFDVAATRKKAPEVYAALNAGRPMELSTGLFTDNIPATNGKAPSGQSYDYIAKNYKPDHLAILPNQKGACSLKDGCGLLIGNTSCTCQEKKEIDVTSNEDKRSLWRKLGEMIGVLNTGPIGNSKDAAVKELQAAIDLHQKHMDGTAPTTGPDGKKSQQLMMSQMKKSLQELLTDNFLGLTDNGFCPTGPGGGQDNSCSSKEGGSDNGGDRNRPAKLSKAIDSLKKNPKIQKVTTRSQKMGDGTTKKVTTIHGSDKVNEDQMREIIHKALDKHVGKDPDSPLGLHGVDVYKHGAYKFQFVHNDDGVECDCGGTCGECKNKATNNCGGVGGKPGPCAGEGGGGSSGSTSDMANKASGFAKAASKKAVTGSQHKVALDLHQKAMEHHEAAAKESTDPRHIEHHKQSASGHKSKVEFHKGRMGMTKNQETDMSRTDTIKYLTTNCDCWKGKAEVLANEDAFTDADLTKLAAGVKTATQNALVANAVAESFGDEFTSLTVNAMPQFIKDKIAAKEGDPEEDDKEEVPEVPVKNKKPTKNAMTKDEFEAVVNANPELSAVWNTAKRIEQTEKRRLINRLTANCADAVKKAAMVKRFSSPSVTINELEDLVSLLPSAPAARKTNASMSPMSYFGSQPIAPVANADEDASDDLLDVPVLNFATK